MNAITKDRQKEFMARTLVGMVMHNQRELTDEECAVYRLCLVAGELEPGPLLDDYIRAIHILEMNGKP